MTLAPRAEYHSRQLSITDALEAFDRWDPVARRAGGLAYVRVMLYAAGEVSFEELVRAVVVDHGHDPERWQGNGEVVHSAFQTWKGLTRPFVPGDEVGKLTGPA